MARLNPLGVDDALAENVVAPYLALAADVRVGCEGCATQGAALLDHLLATPPPWIDALPPPFDRVITTLLSPVVLGAVALASLLMLLVSAIALPWLLARIPADHFSQQGQHPPKTPTRLSVGEHLARIGRNVVGVLLLLAGTAMLVLPGQGLLTLFIALVLVDFPRKHDLQRWLVRREPVFRGLNALRRRVGAPPFQR